MLSKVSQSKNGQMGPQNVSKTVFQNIQEIKTNASLRQQLNTLLEK